MINKVKILLDVCELIIDCEHKTAPTQAEGYPSIRTPNIGRGRLILDGVNRVSEETYRQWTQRAEPRSHDLILAREAPVGNVAIIPDNLRVCLGQRTVLIRPDKKLIDPTYLLYLLLGKEMQAKIHSLSNGATVHHLNMAEIKNLSLPELPPFSIQQKIGDILSAYDDLIENNTRRIAILEETARSLYQEWFVKFRFPGHEAVTMVASELGMIPEGWHKVNLVDMCAITMGQSPSSEFYNKAGEGLPFHQGVADFGGRFPTNRVYCTLENRLALPGDILFSVRAPVGRLNLATEKIVIGRGLCAIRSKSASQEFIFQQLKEIFQEEDSMGNGAIFKAVTKDEVYGIQLVWPSIVSDLLPDLVLKFEKLIQPIFASLENLHNKNANLRRTRDLLLPRLIAGEIDVERVVEMERECAVVVAD